ncbi:MAG: hypothetical protein WD738_04895 [Pirellulales bacterium]
MLVPVTKLVGGLVLVVVLLGFCWYALMAGHRSDDADQLNEHLIQVILSDEPPLLSTSLRRPSLIGQSRPDELPAE